MSSGSLGHGGGVGYLVSSCTRAGTEGVLPREKDTTQPLKGKLPQVDGTVPYREN